MAKAIFQISFSEICVFLRYKTMVNSDFCARTFKVISKNLIFFNFLNVLELR